MNILIIGGGGRESAIAWAVSRSPLVRKVYISPGNGGTLNYGENVVLALEYPFGEVIEFCEDAEIDLVIVGPEGPLVDGIVDCVRREGIRIFGPSQRASQLEGSKSFMKEFLARNKIPTARFKIFDDAKEASEYVTRHNTPFVVKTDGLAAGKGAIVNKTVQETLESINRILVKREFGDAGNRIVIEDLLDGDEISVFILTDGRDYRWLASAQDHKRIFDGDKGPNTGGMGAYAPVTFLDTALKDLIDENIIAPTIDGMAREGNPYTGILYVGLMITRSGPSVLEYNVRLGDPEAQVVLPLIETDTSSPFPQVYTDAVLPQPVRMETVAAFLECALGLSAWKEYGGSRWALRCNPSSGNLHPTEGYLIAGPAPGRLSPPARCAATTWSAMPRKAAARSPFTISANCWPKLSESKPGSPPGRWGGDDRFRKT